ncbi:MAG: sugar O-acyltransferase, sialic acid O-acetyltransferase NeuD family [Moraxellaceae bacterium]|jgi:sugar O-acyltransferase (sialic acid O-acetyltransferase NeuD family)|nr:sugar O-acyltransferase, sialic acid O-acetyltransferase NeuD family [Moraxellaceae bacterium]
MKQILIYGAGGFAREVAWLVEQCTAAGQAVQPVGFIDDNPDSHGKELNGIKVYSLDQAAAQFPQAEVVLGLGAPALREKLATRVQEKGLGFATLVHPRVEKSRFIEMGEGTVICAGSILTTNIRLGRQVQINLDCTVGHDVVMEDFVTLAPGVHVSGCVILEKGAYVGTGASIINGRLDCPLVIGANAVIGAAACVTRDIPPDVTAVGIPAKPLVKK